MVRAFLNRLLIFAFGMAAGVAAVLVVVYEPAPTVPREAYGSTIHETTFPVYVRRVVDGDTVDLLFDLGPVRSGELGFGFYVERSQSGKSHVMYNAGLCRLYGINTPEVTGPEKPDGIKASEHLKDMLSGRVIARTQPGQERGKFGRPLVTLFNGRGWNVNAKMVRDGHAVEADY